MTVDEDTIAIMIIFDDHHHLLSMCPVNECQESFHLILLEMSSFSISVLQMKHKEVKSVLPKTILIYVTELRLGPPDSQGHPLNHHL